MFPYGPVDRTFPNVSVMMFGHFRMDLRIIPYGSSMMIVQFRIIFNDDLTIKYESSMIIGQFRMDLQ